MWDFIASVVSILSVAVAYQSYSTVQSRIYFHVFLPNQSTEENILYIAGQFVSCLISHIFISFSAPSGYLQADRLLV